ncbi:MAG: nitroreductase family protein [Candidatus Thorarchaeota archaeon]
MSESNEILQVIHNLRSIRNFSEKEISNETLQTIIEASVCAANSSARQNYSIIVVNDKETLAKFFYGANKGLLFCVDYSRLEDMANHIKQPFNMNDIRSFITGSTDTILVAQTAVIAAKSLGVDSLFTNSIHRYPMAEIYAYFNLPSKFCFPLLALCLGYAKEYPPIKKNRWKGSGLVHYEKHQRLTSEQLDDIISAYENEDNHLALRTKAQLSELGFEHYLDWYFSQWNQLVSKEALDDIVVKLRESRFIFSRE